jgi:hypothetical protein
MLSRVVINQRNTGVTLTNSVVAKTTVRYKPSVRSTVNLHGLLNVCVTVDSIDSNIRVDQTQFSRATRLTPKSPVSTGLCIPHVVNNMNYIYPINTVISNQLSFQRNSTLGYKEKDLNSKMVQAFFRK